MSFHIKRVWTLLILRPIKSHICLSIYETLKSDVLALAEMKSSIPAQLTELLDLEMNGLSFDYVLNFSENIRSGELLDVVRER